MRIKSVRLQNFKRFSDLTLDELPASAKLVMLVGANGSGKSCVFDAFNVHHERASEDDDYMLKRPAVRWTVDLTLHGGGELSRNNEQGTVRSWSHPRRLFGRPSLRVVPVVQGIVDSAGVIREDRDRSATFTELDRRFDADVAQYTSRIDQALREPTFAGRSADTAEIFRTFIDPLNSALRRVFGSDPDVVIQIKNYRSADPQRPVQLCFSKGTSTIPFDYLSHGEKQVVILLLGFAVRQEHLTDSLVFIDEMDLHLSTTLQHRLLAEVTERWIPDSSQLWTASHALGFIEYALESEHAVVIDLDALNFDQPQVLVPTRANAVDIVEIAVPRDSLAKLFAGRTIVVCEGKDQALYNAACDDRADLLFVPPGGSDNAEAVLAMARHESGYIALRDRDWLMDDEIELIRRELTNWQVLPYYSIESLLYHPDNLASLGLPGFDAELWRKELEAFKRARPIRDAKHARGRIQELRTVEALRRRKATDAEPRQVYEDQESEDFERWYRVLRVKEAPKSSLESWNLTATQLARAPWFRSQLRALFPLQKSHRTA